MHPTYGKIGIVLAGGGCRGFTQLPRLKVLIESGFEIDHISSSSVGSYNAMGLVEKPGIEGVENTIRIWKEYMYHKDKIYKPHPIIEKRISELMKKVPHSPFHRHETWTDLYEDFRTQIKNVFWNVPTFLFRAVHAFSSIPLDRENLPSQVGVTLNQILELIGFLESKAFYDLVPLHQTLLREINLQKIIESPIEWSIIAERYEDDEKVTFSNREFVRMESRLAHPLLFKRIVASAALTPAFEMIPIENSNGHIFHYRDGDVNDPVSISEAIKAGCNTIFLFLNMPDIYTKSADMLEDFLGYHLKNRKFIKSEIRNAQWHAKKEGINLFVSRPKSIHSDMGLLKISPHAIAFHEERDRETMKEYMQNLDAHNLRLCDDIP